MSQRPVSVTIVALVYIAAGAVGFVYHLTDFRAGQPFPYDVLGVELVRVVAIVCGLFLLRADKWARWVAVAWMAFHVVISIFHDVPQLVMHSVILVLIAWVLFRPAAGRYFQTEAGSSRLTTSAS